MSAEVTTTREVEETVRLTADVIACFLEADVLRVLVIRRRWAPFADRWALPGGHVDPGETVRVAAARELAEETGFRTHPDGLAGPLWFSEPGRDPRGRYVTAAFGLFVGAGPSLPDWSHLRAADDAAEFAWRDVRELLREGMAFDHAAILREFFRSEHAAQIAAVAAPLSGGGR